MTDSQYVIVYILIYIFDAYKYTFILKFLTKHYEVGIKLSSIIRQVKEIK